MTQFIIGHTKHQQKVTNDVRTWYSYGQLAMIQSPDCHYYWCYGMDICPFVVLQLG